MTPPRPSPAEAEQIAFSLGAGAGTDVAFLRARQGIYFARAPRRAPADPPALSPVVRLLRGVYELEPRRAVWIVRNRVFSTAPVSASCAGAVRVAARRLEAPVGPADHGLPLPAEPIDAGAAIPPPARAAAALEARLEAIVREAAAFDGVSVRRVLDDAGWMALALRLAAKVGRAGVGAPGTDRPDKPIAALLVGPGGDLLGWATNTGSRNATLHAEANLLDGWLARARAPLPPGARVFATLKPCKMCAGLIWDAAADRRAVRVLYAAEDPRRYARETVLDAGSMDRKRVAASPAEAALEVQARLGPAR